jgi:hypothetical protein
VGVDHPLNVARGGAGVVIIFMVITWTVGGVVGVLADHEEDQDKEVPQGASEAESPEDQEEGQGSGAMEADSAGGEVAVLSPEEQAERERIWVYEWVRESIKKPTGSGVAVHLRELWLSLQKEDGAVPTTAEERALLVREMWLSLQEGGAVPTMAEVRALLEGHQITIRDGVKAPASDKNGAIRNRPGVHSADLPQSFTPLPTQGSNLIRLLPTYQAPDQQ